MVNPNLPTTLGDFRGYHAILVSTEPSRETLDHIRREANCCSDLMNYSYEVADVHGKEWKELDKMLTDIYVLLNEL